MIPATPAYITTDWLGDRMGRPVTSIAVANLGEGVGVMAEVSRISVTWGDDDPSRPR
jgi:hypothetical protein